MHLLGERILGIVILSLLGILVAVKYAATGSILDKPRGNLIMQLVNIFNLFFLLAVNPAAAICLILRRLPAVDPTHLVLDRPAALAVVESLGLMFYLLGFLLMAWALLTLGRYYQLGGSAPRSDDHLMTGGPYRLIRHPMYTAALIIALGLACLVQSWAVLGVFGVYLALMAALIPVEEDGLRKAYGERYRAYQQKTKKLIPLVY